jgi:uncharacterized protein
MTLFWLCAAAFAGGGINSIAGGGTLLTFPALVAALAGLPEPTKLANGTSTLALFPASLASAWGYRAELKRQQRWFWQLLGPSLIGGLAGSLLAVWLPEKQFRVAVPYLILTATTLLVVQPYVSRLIQLADLPSNDKGKRINRTKRLFLVLMLQIMIAVYGGYFGAGIGILMLATLGFAGLDDIHEMNAVKAMLGSVINGTTVGVFIVAGNIYWPFAIPMMIAGTAGGWAGAVAAKRVQKRWVRGIVIAIGLALSAYYFSVR